MMRFITLLTDFGVRDGAVGLMKGVIWRIAPETQIADLSHTISPQNLQEAAVVLQLGAPYFPKGTIHIVVVDPGVGTQRRPIAAQFGDYFFVGPDNGVCTPLLDMAAAQNAPITIVDLDEPEYWLPQVSNIFHGRDIFAPVAAHLAAGVPLTALGTAIDDPIRFDLPQPTKTANGLRGEIVFIDDFGNLQTNMYRDHLAELGPVRVKLAGTVINGMVDTFGDRPPGSLIALYGTEQELYVSVVNGSAAARLGARVGDVVQIIAGDESAGRLDMATTYLLNNPGRPAKF